MKENRNLGLDIIRSMAISLVLICHFMRFSKGINTTFMVYCGIVGVELFFVLSGFLIGKIILIDLLKHCTINSLKRFYIRRWFRTLPLYYLVLFMVSIINNTTIPKRNFIFIQNYNKDALSFLPTSWSLSVEEWFYLIIPVILIIIFRIFSNKKMAFFITTVVIALFSFILRCYVVFKFNPSWDYGIRKQIFLRMDAIMFGVILSGVKFYLPKLYKNITENKFLWIISIGGLTILGIIYILYLGVGDNFNNLYMCKIFLFTLIPFLSGMLIMWMESSLIINKNRNIIKKMFEFISEITYGIYLIHWTVFEIISNKIYGFEGYIISIIITILLAKIIYVVYESPMMMLRDKFSYRNGI